MLYGDLGLVDWDHLQLAGLLVMLEIDHIDHRRSTLALGAFFWEVARLTSVEVAWTVSKRASPPKYRHKSTDRTGKKGKFFM